MARLVVITVVTGLLAGAESQVSDMVDRSEQQGFLSKYMPSRSDASKASLGDYDKFVVPNLNHMKQGVKPLANTKDFELSTIIDKEEQRAAEKMLAHDSSRSISISAIGVMVLTLVTLLGIRVRRELDKVVIFTPGSGESMAPASDSNALEMKASQPSFSVEKLGWDQQATKKLQAAKNAGPLTLAYARSRLLDELADMDGETTVDSSEAPSAAEATSAPAAKPVALEPETLFFEGPPSKSELVIPTLSILTVIGIIPFAAALSRQFWVRYKITSRRISVQSGFNGGDFTEIVYSDIVNLKYVFRGSNEVGDMVIELRDGAKLEMRFVPQFKEIYKYIMDKLTPQAREDSFAME
jgi:hypothetical protein